MQKRPPENQLRFPNSISVMSFNVTNIIEERCKVSRDFLSFSHLPELGSFCGKITENKTKKNQDSNSVTKWLNIYILLSFYDFFFFSVIQSRSMY